WISSTLLPVFFGAALGNLLRGLPVDEEGWFSLPLFTDFSAAPPLGILDWYTVLVGVFALVALAAHGGLFLAWKTEGALHEGSRAWGRRLYVVGAVLWPILTLATQQVHHGFLLALASRPLSWLLAAAALVGLAAVFREGGRDRSLRAFLGSCAF